MKRLNVTQVKRAFDYIRDNLIEQLLSPSVENVSPICAHGASHVAFQAIGAVQFNNVNSLRMPERKKIIRLLMEMTGASPRNCRKITTLVVDQNDGCNGLKADPLKALQLLYFFMTGEVLNEEFWSSNGSYEFNSRDLISVAYKMANTVAQMENPIAA